LLLRLSASRTRTTSDRERESRERQSEARRIEQAELMELVERRIEATARQTQALLEARPCERRCRRAERKNESKKALGKRADLHVRSVREH
jgi:hypothetical protein